MSDSVCPAEGDVSSFTPTSLFKTQTLTLSHPLLLPPLPPSLLSAHSLSSPPPPLPPSLPRQEEVSVFRLETYLTEPRRPESRRLRSFSSPPDTGQRSSSSSSSSCFQLPPLAPPLPVSPSLPVGRLVSEERLMILHVCWQLVVMMWLSM